MLLRSIENRTLGMLTNLQHRLKIETKNVLIQPVRYKNVINTLKPRTDHFWAKKMKIFYQLKKPREFDEHLPMSYKCRKQFTLALKELDKEEENPYERILANEIKEELLQSKMVLMIHRNPVGGYECFEATKKFVKSGMNVITHGKNTVRMAVADTKYVNIMHLFQANTLTWLITCPEVKLHLALELLKKMPFHVLLAGIIEDQFMYRHELDKYGKLKSVDEARAQLLATLNAPTVQLVQNLTHHQNTTVAYLNEYVKMKSATDGSAASGTSSDTKKEDEEENRS